MRFKTMLLLPALAAGLLLVNGCVTRPYAPTFAMTGDPVVDGRNYIQHGPERDKVLWQYRTAAAAMRRGQFADAKELLDEALLNLGGTLSQDKNARRSRRMFNEEAKKTFIGEPYERVMAYYYRGILYWMDGEPDNARACFRSALIHDADAENREYASDYVLLDYLDGFATAKLAGDGLDALKRARNLNPRHPLPDYDPHANVLLFVEFGAGPIKYATGEYGEQLRFREGKSLARSAVIHAGNQSVRAFPYDDLYFQATTRGGRVMDHVLANKAVFKSTTDTVGNAALISGLVLSQNRQTQEAALGLAAFGLLSKAISASTTPSADARMWDNLPQYLSFAALRLPPGEHPVRVEFLNDAGRLIPALTRTFTVPVAATDQDTVLFVSDQKK